MIKQTKFINHLLAFVLITFIGVSCKDEETVAPTTAPPAQEEEDVVATAPEVQTNEWILEVMNEVYLWNDEIPAELNVEQDPTEFFKGLLSSKDRFSHIIADYQELMNSLNGVSSEAGYEFLLARASETNDDVIAVVLYVKNDSPAKEAGMKRGDVITKINGQTITVSNYRGLLDKIEAPHTIDFRRFNEAENKYVNKAALSLNTLQLAENPNYLDTVYVAPNGKKVGYFVYNFFSPGVSGKEYDAGMDQVIADFKSKGVNELILDLRYNSGGAVSSASNMASLIGRGVSSSKVFYQNQWNAAYQDYFSQRPDGDDILRGKFIDKPVNIGNDLTSGTVYVLVGSRTASASELIINGLRPYMDVVIIGEKTVGKNVGSIPIEDEENPDNHYGLLPIVFQIANSLGESDYAQGFSPTAANEVDEFELMPLRQLGDISEPLLARAMALISPESSRTATTKRVRETHAVTPIMSSIDNKLRSNRLFIDHMPKR